MLLRPQFLAIIALMALVIVFGLRVQQGAKKVMQTSVSPPS
jgi:hypothetical protein